MSKKDAAKAKKTAELVEKHEADFGSQTGESAISSENREASRSHIRYRGRDGVEIDGEAASVKSMIIWDLRWSWTIRLLWIVAVITLMVLLGPLTAATVGILPTGKAVLSLFRKPG